MARRRIICGLLAASAVAAGATPAAASPPRRQVDISGGRLSAALAEFARETGAELLYDERLVGELRVSAVRGRLSRRDALSRLLAGTGVAFREVGGSFVLSRSAAAAEPLVADDPPAPEILVIGRRTQNSDIRRTRNDIQPYRVITRREIDGAHREDVEQLIRSREPLNVRPASPSQSGDGGNTSSDFDFRGVGSLRSLVLVDGRRMPSYPTNGFDLGQPDVNGIPLAAIERVETRTGTAGGIYGPGALGGVLNLVLRRDYRGAELRVTSGITSRGDARTFNADLGIGFSPDGGRTDVTLAASHRRTEPLLQGKRDYLVRQRQLQFANSPSDYATLNPFANAILVFGSGGRDLVFDPEYGGDSLGSPVSFLPIGFSGTPEEARQLLRENAGRTVFALAEDSSGSYQHLGASPEVTSVIANVRHRISNAVEFYADGLFLRNTGRQTAGGYGLGVTFPEAPTNPFNQFVRFSFPRAVTPQRIRQDSDVSRISAGMILRLPGGWSASGEYTWGRAAVRRTNLFALGSSNLQGGLQYGTPNRDGRVVDPLGPWEDLRAAIVDYTAEGSSRVRVENRFEDMTLRLAGPVVRLPAGPMTATLLAERRREHIPRATLVDRFSKPDRVRETNLPGRSQIVSSAYGELRAPVSGDAGLLRNLQIQLALRYDRSVSLIPEGVGFTLRPEERPRGSRREALTYTAGAQFHPAPGLMLRASLATGELPPSLVGLRAYAVELGSASPFSNGGTALFPDPQRGGRPVGSERLVRVLFGGIKDAPPERAQTLAVGAVLNPSGGRWPRVSVDYTRLRIRRQPLLDVFPLERPWGVLPQLLANEESGRLRRAPLTDADRALGFTGGIITQADVRGLLLGTFLVEALDLELDWALPPSALGSFRIYGRGTWHPTHRRRTTQFEPQHGQGDDLDGPLTWRGHGGVEWTGGATTIGVDAQFFGSYRSTYGTPAGVISDSNAQRRRLQGRDRIPSQIYFDLSVRHRLSAEIELSAGVINIFDRSPPIVADTSNFYGYSFYGDPRRRRFELTVASKF